MSIVIIKDVSIELDWSWVPVIALMIWSFARSTMPALVPELFQTHYWLMAVATGCGLVVSLLVREAAFVAIGTHAGMPLHKVKLYPFGGVARMAGAPLERSGELVAGVVATLVSLLIGLLLLLAFIRTSTAETPLAISGVVLALMALNWLVALLNLLPAYPLLGGRGLRALLTRASRTRPRATAIALALSGGIAALWVLGGLALAATGSPVMGGWLIAIGALLVWALIMERPWKNGGNA